MRLALGESGGDKEDLLQNTPRKPCDIWLRSEDVVYCGWHRL